MKTRGGKHVKRKKKRQTRRGGGKDELRMVQNYKDFALYMDTKISNELDSSKENDDNVQKNISQMEIVRVMYEILKINDIDPITPVENDTFSYVTSYLPSKVKSEIRPYVQHDFDPQTFFGYLKTYVDELNKKIAFEKVFFEFLRENSNYGYQIAEYENAKQITDTTTRNDVNKTLLDIITNQSQDNTATIKSIMELYAKNMISEPEKKKVVV
jgi:hypothetical protein